LVRRLDRHGQRRLGGSVHSVAEARVESVEGGVADVSGDTGFGEGRLGRCVRAVGNCKGMMETRSELRYRQLARER
jgi:hypothetical protein